MKYVFYMLISVSLLAVTLSSCAPTSTNSMTTTTAGPTETMEATTIAATETTETTTAITTETTETTTAITTETTETNTAITYQDLSPAEAKELIDNTPDLIIIDVSPRFDEGRLPGAVNYYVGDGTLDEVIPTLDKSKIYLVYCHVDSVSILGAQKLIDAGFTSVYRLEGNYSAWVAAGYDIEK